MARTSSVVITCTGARRNTGRSHHRGGLGASRGRHGERVGLVPRLHGEQAAVADLDPDGGALGWTASTIGARRSIRSRVCTRVMPGDVRPSS